MSGLAPHCDTLLAHKATSRKTFATLAAEVDKPEAWLAAVFFGHAVASVETAARIARAVGCSEAAVIDAMNVA